MVTYRAGDIVLLHFPYADLSGTKLRPSLVIIDAGDVDVVVARITSQPVQSEFDVELVQWKESGLAIPSLVRLHKLFTASKSSIVRKIGVSTSSDRQSIGRVLQKLPINFLNS